MVTFFVAGSTNDISRTKASSEPPKSFIFTTVRPMPPCMSMTTYLDDPRGCFLFAAEDTFRADYSCCWINRAVENIDGNDMSAVWVGIFVPHSNDDVRPWMAI